jgi:hypothetical protein
MNNKFQNSHLSIYSCQSKLINPFHVNFNEVVMSFTKKKSSDKCSLNSVHIENENETKVIVHCNFFRNDLFSS